MTAKEMFEELGYKYETNSRNDIQVSKESYYGKTQIYFDYTNQLVGLGIMLNDGFNHTIKIDIAELDAINKQVEELRWK